MKVSQKFLRTSSGGWLRCKLSYSTSERRFAGFGWLAHGWSQDVLANRSGLHRAHISEIERGETNMTLQWLETLADTLKVRVTDLLKGF